MKFENIANFELLENRGGPPPIRPYKLDRTVSIFLAEQRQTFYSVVAIIISILLRSGHIVVVTTRRIIGHTIGLTEEERDWRNDGVGRGGAKQRYSGNGYRGTYLF